MIIRIGRLIITISKKPKVEWWRGHYHHLVGYCLKKNRYNLSIGDASDFARGMR